MVFEEYSWVLYIAQGIFITLKYSVLSVILGLVIGTFMALLTLSPYALLRFIARAYVSIIRGTPLLLQLTLFFYAVPNLLGVNISAFVAGVTVFAVNSGAYVTEIIRSGIMSVDKGQFEAAYSLSIPYRYMMKDIIIPQAARNVLPALVNEIVNLVKESALISVIGEADLLRRATIVSMYQYSYFAPMLVAAACYYLLVVVLSYCAKKLEMRLHAKY